MNTERLKKTRTAYRGVLTKRLHGLADLTDLATGTEPNVDRITSTIERVIETERKIDEIQNELESVVAEEDDEEDELIRIIEEYNDLKDEVKLALTKAHRIIENDVGLRIAPKVEPKSERSMTISLPKLNLPIFSGEFTEWQMFHDSFCCAVHSRKDLSDVDKFSYLRSQLRSKALDVIRGFSLNAVNYETAFNLLCERFGKKNLIIRAHIKSLLNLPVIQPNNMKSLSNFINQVEAGVRSLNSLGISDGEYSCILVQIVLFRLPDELNIQFARFDRNGDSSITDLIKFLNDELSILQSSHDYKSSDRSKPSVNRPNVRPFASSTCVNQVSDSKRYKCGYCKGEHWIDQCQSFRKLKIDDRHQSIKENGLCFNCLKRHMLKECKSSFSCKTCGAKHHTLLHKDRSQSIETENGTSLTTDRPNTTTTSSMTNNSTTGTSDSSSSVLSTALVRLNHSSKCYRILFDGGSQLSYVKRSVVDELRIKSIGSTMLNIATFGELSSASKRYPVVEVNVQNRFDKQKAVKISCVVVEKLCSPIQCTDLSEVLKHFQDSHSMAENLSVTKKSIDLLIGTDMMYDILSLNASQMIDGLCLTDTLFGYVVHGRLSYRPSNSSSFSTACNFVQTSNSDITPFWETESLGIERQQPGSEKYSIGELKALDNFEANVKRENYRYEVTLPWKEEYEEVPNQKEQALSRLRSTLRKLNERPEIFKAYSLVMSEYLRLGMIEKVDESRDGKIVRYLPHRPVVRLEKTTTKVRPVFDASACDATGTSLNSMLLSGPSLLPELFDILIRMRAYAVTLFADIEKAFLQIAIRKEDRDALRFVWIEDNEISSQTDFHKHVDYRWTRLPFGLTSSPFLLQAVIRRHLREPNTSVNPATIDKISSNLYVDDLVLSVEDEETAKRIKDESSELFKSCAMDLRKWVSNHISLNEVEHDEVKVLGLKYNRTEDTIRVEPGLVSNHSRVTKRIVLQTIASIYDPLGLITPFTTTLKIFMQNVCKQNQDWDESLDDRLAAEWRRLLIDLSGVESVAVPRSIHFTHGKVLHLFCDASTKAYGAVVYVSNENNEDFHLVTSKSKIAPIRGVTLPRLELMAACVGSLLLKSVCTALNYPINKAQCWSDSQITLAWIKHDVDNLKQFVGNRVKIIQTNTKAENWSYVESKNNPADLVSRGCDLLRLRNSSLWWKGPCDPLPRRDRPIDLTRDMHECVENEIRSKSSVQSVISGTSDSGNLSSIVDVNRFSSWIRLLKVTALILRFIDKCRSGRSTSKDTRKYILDAEKRWLHDLQGKMEAESSALKDGQPLPHNSKLQILSPIIDSDGLLRSKTRLENSKLPTDTKLPYILNEEHPAIALLILHYHNETLHGGVQTVAVRLRQRFVFFKMNRKIKSIIRTCVTCRKAYLKPYNSIVPSLPQFRVDSSNRVFECCGLDYTGPLYVKENDSVVKVYILLFTCTVFRAVHLEYVEDLSTRELMNALNMFFSRRGVPRMILSDNAKSFCKAKEILSLSQPSIEWRNIPERAPWYGGFWERLMGVIKRPIRKTLGNSMISKRAMMVLLTVVEGVVNSRPLTHVSNDLRDPLPLTPNHFLLGKTCDENVDPLSVCVRVDLPAAYRSQQTLLVHFCNRFKREYLSFLRSVCWKDSEIRNISSGDLVMLRNERTKCFNWPLGLVIKLFPGPDSISRVALVKTKSGILRRAIQSLIPLESALNHVNRDNRNISTSVIRDISPLELREQPASSSTSEDADEGDTQPYQENSTDIPERRSRFGRVIQPVDKFI